VAPVDENRLATDDLNSQGEQIGMRLAEMTDRGDEFEVASRQNDEAGAQVAGSSFRTI